jgi:hypothetical protein
LSNFFHLEAGSSATKLPGNSNPGSDLTKARLPGRGGLRILWNFFFSEGTAST